MKILSLSFTPVPEDFTSYSKKAEPALFSMRMKRGLIPFAIMFVFGLMFGIYFSILALSLFVINNVVPFILNREYMKKQLSSRIIKRPVVIDFYDDHIVQTFLPDESFKGTNEKHFGLRSVAGVVESDEYIWFLTKAANVINIPKRVLTAEQYEEIRSIKDNFFANKYQKI